MARRSCRRTTRPRPCQRRRMMRRRWWQPTKIRPCPIMRLPRLLLEARAVSPDSSGWTPRRGICGAWCSSMPAARRPMSAERGTTRGPRPICLPGCRSGMHPSLAGVSRRPGRSVKEPGNGFRALPQRGTGAARGQSGQGGVDTCGGLTEAGGGRFRSVREVWRCEYCCCWWRCWCRSTC